MINNTIILILGMHRSGTSCLAGSLQQRGLYLGEVIEKSLFNYKGNRENISIRNLNDSILEFSKGSWDSPPDKIIWNDNHKFHRQSIIDNFVYKRISLWGFKDPRTIITLPFWLEVLREPKLIASFRHPTEVAKSLSKRNSFNFTKSLNLWYHYNSLLLPFIEKDKIFLINFNSSPEEYIESIIKISKVLGLNTENIPTESNFYDSRLNNNELINENQNKG